VKVKANGIFFFGGAKRRTPVLFKMDFLFHPNTMRKVWEHAVA
jgi:hypothetical protein